MEQGAGVIAQLPSARLSSPRSITPAGLAARSMGSSFQLPNHLVQLNGLLKRIIDGDLKRLLVLMPPRHGKSTLCSQFFPATFLGLFPDKQVILTSYEADYAKTWGRRSRDVLEELGHRTFDIEVRDDSSAAHRWGIQGHLGGMQTSGVGGAMTGKGADVLIIDDPVKNAAEANSQVYRDHTWEWYQSTAYTRLEPGGAIVLVMTHWHQDDLAGRILQDMEDGGEEWEVLRLPARAGSDTPGREDGEALWRSRYNEERLLQIERTVGPYWWLALYQQEPSKPMGTVFQRLDFRYFRMDGEHYVLQGEAETPKRWLKTDCLIFTTVDDAESESKKADFTAVATWAVTPDADLLLLEMVRVHLETPDILPLLQQNLAKWNPSYIGIEGRPVYTQARRAGLPVRRLRADKDKWTRAQPASARMSSHSIFFLAGAQWVGDLELELLAFPTGSNDDQVDVVAYGALEVQKGPARRSELGVEVVG